jgi:hypothetical protein
MTRSRNLTIFLASLLITATSFADGTRTWEQSKLEDLENGTTDGVAIRSDGSLELAPAFKATITTPSPYVWAIATARDGNLYAATGTPARVYRITPDGKSSAIFQSQELQVQSLVVGDNGEVYAATNPDGKIYRLEPAEGADSRHNKSSDSDSTWHSSVFFDPGSKYIWDLALDKMGNLYVATGDHGEIFRVTPKGDHTVFFKSDETHIRVLAFDRQDNLIAGSDGSGLVYRISPNGEGFVLYSAPKKEITALAVDATGNIYAAGVGEKRNSPATLPSLTISSSSPAPAQPNAGSALGLSMGNPMATPATAVNLANFGSNGASGSEIYRISSDGGPTRIWGSREDLVYALAFNSNGELLAGTGNRGHIFLVSGEDKFTDLLKASASQITAFAPAPKNGLYASSSNLGKIFLLGASPNASGTYVSDVFDAHIFSRWGRTEFRGRGNVELFARSGNVDNPDRNWSPWKKVEWQKDAEISVPPARFIQWKAILYAGNPSPRVERVTINYLSKNVAPDFDDVTVQESVRYQPNAKSGGDGSGNVSGNSQHVDTPPSPTHDRDSIGVKWGVHDDNDDDMVYSIYYRGEGESRWLLLKDNLSDKFYSFDSSLLPDGAYTIKVVASDAPSHSPGEGLRAERESARFEMDTTPPRIEDLRASVEASQVHVTFRAVDGFSPIQKGEYSLDAGDWQLVEPVGQISDSKTENYDFRADLQPAIGLRGSNAMSSEHVVVVRAYDRHDNMASAKTVIVGK